MAAGVLSGDGGSECSLGTGNGGKKSGIWTGAFHSIRSRFLDGDEGIETGEGGKMGEGSRPCSDGGEPAGSSTTMSVLDS